MNPDKTDVIVIDTSARQQMEGSVANIDVCSFSVKTTHCVGTLESRNRRHAVFNDHLDNLCTSSNFYLMALRHIWNCLSDDISKIITHSMVESQLDYCNCVLYRTSALNISEMQCVEDLTAWIVTCSGCSDHINNVLAGLHWLPVEHRITYEIVIIAFKMLTKLHDLHPPTCSLRFSSINLLQQISFLWACIPPRCILSPKHITAYVSNFQLSNDC